MIVGLLSIFGVYGLAVALVHLGRSWFGWKPEKPVHYLLLTKNNAMHIEWYLRSLLFFSWLKARTVKIAVLDECSEDDTKAIAERLSAERPEDIQVLSCGTPQQLDQIIAGYENEEVVLVRLSQTTELQNIPSFQ